MKKLLCGMLVSTTLLCTSAISANAAIPDFDIEVSSSKNFYEVSEQADIHIEATNQSNNDFENVIVNDINIFTL